jgi:hypothetical protein
MSVTNLRMEEETTLKISVTNKADFEDGHVIEKPEFLQLSTVQTSTKNI